MSFCAILWPVVGHQFLNNTMRSGGAQKIPRPDNSRAIDGNPFQGLDTSALDSIDDVTSALVAFRQTRSCSCLKHWLDRRQYWLDCFKVSKVLKLF